MKKILVIRLSSLGDIILTSATVLNLKLRYPSAEIVYLTKAQYASIADGLPGVTRVVTLPSHATIRETFNLALELDDDQFDLIVDLSANGRSRFITLLVNATKKVTYSKHRFSRERIVRTKSVTSPAPHTIDSYNSALRKVDPDFPLSAKRPLVDDSFCREDLSALPERVQAWLKNGDEIVCLSPGARYATKRAPLALFQAVGERLYSETNVKIISMWQSAEADLSLSDSFSAERYAEIVDAPLQTVAEILKRSQVTLCNDSAIAHLSSALGTPVVALFGPTHSALGFSPRGVFDCVIENDERCRPCSLHGSKPCSREERYCFSRLSVAEISRVVCDKLALQKSLRPALFLDRDGTIIEEKYFLSNPAEVVFYEDAFAKLRQARQAGYKLVIVTNQSGVARGYMSEDDVRAVNAKVVAGLAAEGVEIDAVYYAPKHPQGTVEGFRSADNARKPGEVLFVRAARDCSIDLRRSWVIGDRTTDYLSAKVIGAAGGALLGTGYGEKALEKMQGFRGLQPDLVVPDLAAAVSAILKQHSPSRIGELPAG